MKHRLTWRGYFPVLIEADTKAEAIKLAVKNRPPYADEKCAELHYGMASGKSSDAVYIAGQAPAVVVTAVIFRTFISGGDVIALFPFDPSDRRGHYCNSYQRIGQHAGASPDLMRGNHTRPATPAETEPLRAELIRLGYTLREMKRFPANAFAIRKAAAKV